MLDHLSIQCADLSASATFYDAVLETIGARRVLDLDTRIGYGVEFPSFWLGPLEIGDGFRESHIAFTAPSREAVTAFRDAAVATGAEELHEPRLWPEYPRATSERSCATPTATTSKPCTTHGKPPDRGFDLRLPERTSTGRVRGCGARAGRPIGRD
ncbi:hypothetical protein BH18ACT17_BH18ACT17_07620 [soil metagenome]